VFARPVAVSPLGTPCPKPTHPRKEERPESGALALERINHFVIIYLENHSFDSLYGLFPGADGLVDAQCKVTSPKQVDEFGVEYARLPNPPSANGSPFDDLPNQPFAMEPRVPIDMPPPDLIHRFYTQQAQINGGAMNQFAVFSDARAITMGYYDTMKLPLAKLAAEYTLCDHFFQSAFGGSFLNHMWLIAATSPRYPDLPSGAPVEPVPMDPSKPFPVMEEGIFRGDDAMFTPDYYAVNTIYSANTPHPGGQAYLLPSQTDPTIGDRLSAAGISWAWYAGAWNETLEYLNGTGDSNERVASFQYHHQPFLYFESFKEGSIGRAEHLKDELDLFDAAKSGQLPAVAFVKPTGVNDEHPQYANLKRGEDYTVGLIDAIMSSPNWPDTAIIVTYDENGGFADHVAPPIIDRMGPGTRVPAIVISNYAKKHFVDHTQYETVSILSTIERRFGLEPLTARDQNATDLSHALTLND
jgi:phospholipase C